jgi:hypothetical protein
MLEQIEAVRGYTPLDVLRFKEYLQFIGDADEPLRPFKETQSFERSLTFPVIGNFPVHNKSLLDLLGVRYLLQPSDAPPKSSNWQQVMADPDASVYDFIAGGMWTHPYTLYRNPDVLPRAFVVPEADVMPPRSQALEALRSTDFRKRVLLEGWQPGVGTSTPTGSFREARLCEYRPNRVVIDVNAGAPGYLVLADVWFPGWRCTVDGTETPVYRANYLFRAVPVPAGEHTLVFTFQPDSYRWGKMISSAALGVVLALILLGVWLVVHSPRVRAG